MKELQTIKYQTNNQEIEMLIDYDNETIWLTQDQIVIIFSSSKSNISEHIRKVLNENLLIQSSVVRKFRTTANDGKTYNIKHYNLEIVLLVGNKIDLLITKEFKEYIENKINEYKKANKRFEIVKFIDNTLEIDVNIDPKEETVWLNLNQIVILFERDKSVISRHISKIFKEKELEENSVVAFFATTEADGKVYNVKYFNLDMIISIGYRVNSQRGIMFRKWANKILKEYLLKGFVINKERVKVTEENYNDLITQVNNLTIYNTNIVGQINDLQRDQSNIDERLKEVETKIIGQELPIEKIIYQNEYYDAYSLIQDIFLKATNEIIIIDNYIDKSILDRLVVKKSNAIVTIYTETKNAKITQIDITNFNNQYGQLNIIDIKKVHDRYIIIDQNVLYNIGGSIKDLGKKLTTIHLLDSCFIKTILNNI